MLRGKTEKTPYVKVYFSQSEAKAIQAAVDILSSANGGPIKPKEYAKMAIMSYTEAVGIKVADMQAAKLEESVLEENTKVNKGWGPE